MVARIVRSWSNDLSTDPGRGGSRPFFKLFFWLVILSLYLLGGLALYLRSQLGPVGPITPSAPAATIEVSPALTATPTATLTLTPSPFPTLTPTATLYPTLTPRP
jgi:hypothetical protein